MKANFKQNEDVRNLTATLSQQDHLAVRTFVTMAHPLAVIIPGLYAKPQEEYAKISEILAYDRNIQVMALTGGDDAVAFCADKETCDSVKDTMKDVGLEAYNYKVLSPGFRFL